VRLGARCGPFDVDKYGDKQRVDLGLCGRRRIERQLWKRRIEQPIGLSGDRLGIHEQFAFQRRLGLQQPFRVDRQFGFERHLRFEQ
jgi:hypothetical protein